MTDPSPTDRLVPEYEDEHDAKFICMFSGGLTSYEATVRTIQKYGIERVRIWFADTQNESADLYRFMDEIKKAKGWNIEMISVGLDLWSLFNKEKFIANTRADICSRKLKREPLRKKLKEEFPDPDKAVVVIGMDFTEGDRLKRAINNQLPYKCIAPCAEHPLVDKCKIAEDLEEFNIEPPDLYKDGFPHANCDGFCIKAGLAHFGHLLKERPWVYKYHEDQEQAFRYRHGKDVSVLRDRRGGGVKPYTLKQLREEIENGRDVSRSTWGGCGCFSPEDQDEEKDEQQ